MWAILATGVLKVTKGFIWVTDVEQKKKSMDCCLIHSQCKTALILKLFKGESLHN